MALSPFAAFVAELQQRHGPEVDLVRHELFFQGQKRFPGGRGALALARDALLLARPSRRQPLPTGLLAVLVATLAGSSGWSSLARALPAIATAGLTPVVLAHPRLDPSLFPADVPVLRPGGLGLAGLDPAGWLGGWVAQAQARQKLWIRAVAGLLADRRGVLVLHNDFDMMSTASLHSGWPSVCLLHGIPTDEFFPCRADYQIVWGPSSRQAFADCGVASARLVVDSLGRGAGDGAGPDGPPQVLAVASQTQAVIFGPHLAAHLKAFVAGLHQLDRRMVVLLHPREGGRHPYGAVPTSLPPHVVLQAPQPALVLAHCSTLAIDAALAGHWVAAVEFPHTANQAAYAVATPPLRVKSAGEAFALYGRLSDDEAFRRQAAIRQKAWLNNTFSPETGGLSRLLGKIVPSCPLP
ncbi:hypothetical protein [Magnetospirillum gryphiswaldense]|uniref:Uncharacterized protein n=2 Tax=Magnetospirillum gryphiswaldense TaxID=55518 RepID=V6EXJ0_MAGGM|nr:hypothetical protein [Magnetospirillum gryphiswaldense]AVM73180.1 hypothetical protein MSR1_06720 [Magnetospirillum gryphiswaldense MSR-1]AVM77083.1 hypothetical protein MSR1L_06720 [Magnetospirillum gryphiswaldense]CAM75259.1 conserved hypothetical protein [Magnetospirillum gryphiswaldense MSR-1]CDK97827.1 protein of unknown function [Magnetospirillum gryphiswaldense MSR-1 v2]